jgi:hypothetical protein
MAALSVAMVRICSDENLADIVLNSLPATDNRMFITGIGKGVNGFRASGAHFRPKALAKSKVVGYRYNVRGDRLCVENWVPRLDVAMRRRCW